MSNGDQPYGEQYFYGSLRNENQLLLRQYVVWWCLCTYVIHILVIRSPTYNFSGHIGRLNWCTLVYFLVRRKHRVVGEVDVVADEVVDWAPAVEARRREVTAAER